MIPQPKIPYLYDEKVNFTLGVDSSKSPDLVAEGYSAFGVNVTFRGGKPKNRPAFRELIIPDQTHKELFQNSKQQGEFLYQDLPNDYGYMVAVRGGWVLKIDLTTLAITLLNPADQNNATRRHYFCQADKFLVIQNGEDVPLIWDGVTLRRARSEENNPVIDNLSVSHVAGICTVTTDGPHGFVAGDFVYLAGDIDPSTYIGIYLVQDVPSPDSYRIRVTSTNVTPATVPGNSRKPQEVPIGTYMEYVMGRLCVAMPDRREMRIGDLIRTTPETATVDSVLWFTEETFLAESFRFSLPTNLGRIRAIAAIPYMGAPTGQGDLLISGDRGLATLSLAYPRNEWFDRPIQKIALTGIAIASQTGMVGYNGDVIFRDLEYGIRTFRLAEGEFSKGPAQTPISAEMNRVFERDDPDKLQFSYLAIFDNRLLSTVTPVFEQRAIAVVSLSVAGNTATVTMAEDALHTVGTKVKFTGTTAPNGVEFTVTAVNSDVSFDIDITGQTVTTQGAGGFVQSQETGPEYYHRGLAVLDYTSLSGAQGFSQPAWDGIWTGLNIQSIHKAYISDQPRAIMAVYNDNLHRNELWEVTQFAGPDVGEFTETIAPAWVEFAASDCRKPFSEKKLRRLSLWLTGLRGEIESNIWFRNDGDICWVPWKLTDEDTGSPQFEICATVTTPQHDETNPNFEGLIQSPDQRRVVRLGSPLAGCDPQNTKDARLFFRTQLKIGWTGIMTIDKIQLEADEVVEDRRGGCR